MRNFENGESADLDLESTRDFVNQAGTFQMDALLDQFEQYGQEGGAQSPEELLAQAQVGQTQAKPATDASAIAAQQELAKRRARGQGVGSFAQGFAKGFGLLGQQQQQQPQAQTQPMPSQASFAPERRNWVIPVMVGAIGLAIVVFAMGQSKKGKMPVSLPTAEA